VKISNITIEELQIPFKQAFSHASATRNTTEAVLVKVESGNGFVGYGEGCPRSYVTGETIQTTQEFFNDYKDKVYMLKSLADIKQWAVEHEGVIDQNPAAWCAIELALLDVLGKETQKSLEALLSLPELSGTFRYTAVLGSSNLNTYKKQLQQYIHTGFKDYKIKVSGKFDEDKGKIDALRELGNDIRVRLDANNLWENADQAIKYITALDYPFFAIEEPLKTISYDGCRKIADALGIYIILDESFLRFDQFNHVFGDFETWIINLRISKMGGTLRSLVIAEKAKEYGIPLIIGAQVGETSIITRAALTVANTYRDILLAQEGAFGTHLLEHDVVEKPIMFGKDGILEADLSGFGLGLAKISPFKLC
jgi:L-alanine-DL-glutamate epimerase-like enolase superfamily enzyme